ncbi:MAG TPA: YtxH domain-containing protein [Nitrospiraceae bacterium]|nr:YtxH domain-containing protein [Nitrospiraceae bacterium]
MANEIVHADQGSKLSESMTLFVAGAAVGAIAALLFAPQAGRETRKQLNEYGKRTSDTMNDWATAAYDLFTDHDKFNGRSRQEEPAKANERHDVGAKSQTHAVAR